MKMTVISHDSRASWLWETRGEDLKCSGGRARPFVFEMVSFSFPYCTQRSRHFYGEMTSVAKYQAERQDTKQKGFLALK